MFIAKTIKSISMIKKFWCGIVSWKCHAKVVFVMFAFGPSFLSQTSWVMVFYKRVGMNFIIIKKCVNFIIIKM